MKIVSTAQLLELQQAVGGPQTAGYHLSHYIGPILKHKRTCHAWPSLTAQPLQKLVQRAFREYNADLLSMLTSFLFVVAAWEDGYAMVIDQEADFSCVIFPVCGDCACLRVTRLVTFKPMGWQCTCF